jgi:formate dehydrogenase subunit gamma
LVDADNPMSEPIDDILEAHKPLNQDQLLPVLIALQAQIGAITASAVAAVADAFNLSRAEIVATVSFYTDLHTTPDPRPTVQVCQAEACQAMGARALKNHLESTWIKDVRIEAVYCLGHCACAPAIRVNRMDIARAEPVAVDAAIRAAL